MKKEHIQVVGEFYKHPDLLELSVYGGYNGGIVLRLRTSCTQLFTDVINFCNAHNIEVNSKFNGNLYVHEVYCIADQDDIYDLKGK